MKKKIIIYSVASVLALTGCKDFLNQEPKLTQSTEITLSSYDGLNKSVAGAYGPLASSSWYGASYVLSSDMRSGNGSRNEKAESGRYTQSYEWNYTDDNGGGIWSTAYYVISAANNVINSLEGKTSTEVSEQDINNLKAEALFIRALAHFDLVKIYSQPYTYKKDGLGVPYVKVTDPNGKPARESVENTYKMIVEDLLEAEKAIDSKYVRDGFVDSKASVSIYAIQALLSRVYLYMGDWNNSAVYATKVIDSKAFDLWDAETYPTVWGKDVADDGGEVIFEIYGKKTNGYYGSWVDISWMCNPEGYADTQASPDLISLYKEGDVRRDLYVSKTFEDETVLYWTGKYPGKGDGTPDATNVIILRLSEMYLNRAEATLNGASTGVPAVDDINAVVTKRGLTPYLAVTRTDVQTERRLEFAFEGHYFFDLARWNQSLVRNYFTGNMNQNVEFPSPKWAIPIPKREIQLNENLIQNEQ